MKQKSQKASRKPASDLSPFERTMASIAEKMHLDFTHLTSQFKHKGSRGQAREIVVQQFLNHYLPEFLGVGSGEIYSTDKRPSLQTDVVIYDRFHSPTLLRLDKLQVFLVESVYAVMEVKSYLGKKELRQAVENIRTAKSLPKQAFYPQGKVFETWTIYGREFDYFPMMGYLFAFRSSKLDTLVPLLDELNTSMGIAPEHQIDVICVLDKGVVAHVRNDGKLIGWPESDSAITWIPTKRALLLFYLFIMGQLSQAKMRPLQVKDYLPTELKYGPGEA